MVSGQYFRTSWCSCTASCLIAAAMLIGRNVDMARSEAVRQTGMLCISTQLQALHLHQKDLQLILTKSLAPHPSASAAAFTYAAMRGYLRGPG